MVLFAVLVGTNLLPLNKRIAHAATNNYLNFQARILTSNGGVVPDGMYNVEFKLYNQDSGGSALWTETWTGSNRIRTVNGYISANLGSVNSFSSNINWDQELWITLNIGGTGASPSWDGEMNPRMKVTGVPYAIAAGKLQVTNGSYTSTLSLTAPTGGNQTFVLPNLASATSATVITTGNLNSINAVGTVASGTWNGSAITVGYGGTGISSYVTGDILYASDTTTLSRLAAGSNGYCLMSQGAGSA
ncbi:MAG TPA: hypothetical protein PLJ97_02420, partial [Candidatus Saccharibacteria bacterium]|nr:hypothetical protein [Candidatus Saccharibacteria bacterium]